MAYAQSVYNQSSVLKINVMVVDNDPVYLQDISRMIEKSKYRDPSIMDITVIAVKDSGEALSTLKIERNNIDLIVTDYYMPGMNGLQLKRQIEQEFGNVPVIVMSSDTNKEQESLTCGAMCFIPKPIKVTDLPIIYQLALNYKRNGKSILWNENNHKDTYVSVPQQIQLLPEQANVLKTKKKNCSSRSMTSTNGSCARTDSSRLDRKRTSNGSSGDDVESLSQPTKKKSKLKWTDHLQDLFLQAIRHHTLEKAVPKKILEHMNVPYLTRENVASHLQKYRQFLRKVAEQGLLSLLSIQDIDSIFPHAPTREPHYNYCTPSSTSWYETSLSNRSFYSKPGQGGRLGQSRLLSNTREPVRFNQIPHNYMNRSSTNGPHRIGSNLTLPIKTNLNFSNQPSQNVGRTFIEPTLMANKTVQSSQVLGFGQHGMSAINGNHFNINMMSRYGSLTPNQPGHSQFSYGVQSFLNNENSAYKPQSNADATTQPTLEVPQVENLDLYEDLGITNELPCDTSNFQFDHNKQEGEVASTTNFDLPAKFSTEMNQNFSLEEDGDWNFVNINQGHSNVETPNTFAAPETDSSIPNMNPNHDQEQQDDPDFIDWSLLDPQDLLNEYDDFMDSLFTNDMN